MKKNGVFYLVIFSIVIAGTNVSAQTRAEDDSLAFVEKFLLDFTVPDMPAFKALGTSPSEVLRPSDIKKFAVMMQPFVSNGEAIIPKSFALEVAPFKLMESYRKRPQLSIADYVNRRKDFRRMLYATSISIGSLRTEGEDAVSRISIGLRTSFTGKKGNVLKDADFQSKYIYGPLQEFEKKRATLETEWMRENGFTPAQLGEDSVRDAFATHFRSQYNEPLYSAAVAQYNREYWNASRGELAIAWVGQSPDSLISNIGFGSFDAWGVWAIRVRSHGQLLIGGHFQRVKDSNPEIAEGDLVNVTLNSRFYYGTQNFRMFGEVQYKNKNDVNEEQLGLLNLGSEFRVLKDFWIVLSGGIENVFEDDKSRFVSSLDIRYAFNKPD